MDVQVRRLDEAQMRLARLGEGGERMQRDERAGGAGAGDELAARHQRCLQVA